MSAPTFAQQSGAQIVGVAVNDTEEHALACNEHGLSFPSMDDTSGSLQYRHHRGAHDHLLRRQGQENPPPRRRRSWTSSNPALAKAQ